MKAIIEKQVIMQPVMPGYIINGVTENVSVIVIKFFSIPIYRKEIINREQTL
jgi:hypothetical protein